MINRRVFLTLLLMSLISLTGFFRIEGQEGPLSENRLVDATLIVDITDGAPGSTNNLVSISMINSVPVYGVQFTLAYDPEALTVVNVDSTARTQLMSFFAWNEPVEGSVEVVVLDIFRPIGIGSGSIINCYFNVLPDARCGDYELTLIDVMALNDLGIPLSVDWVDGLFSVAAPGVEISLSDTDHDFGEVNVGTPVPWQLTVFNDGQSNLQVTNIVATPGDYTVNKTSFTVGSCDDEIVTVTFTPSAGGVINGQLTISSNDPDEPNVIVTLTGSGCQSPDIDPDSTSVNFGIVNVGDAVDAFINIYNLGCQLLSVTNVSISGPNANQFSVVSGGEPFSVAAGNFHQITLRFQPTSGGLKPDEGRVFLNMVKTATLSLTHNDTDENPTNIPLSGTGCEARDIAVTPASVNFGLVNQGQAKDTTIVVSNTGCQDLNVTGTTITGTHSDQFSIVTGGGALAIPGGGTHDIIVRFLPTSGGGKNAQLEIDSNDPDEAKVVVAFVGTGCQPQDINVSPGAVNYGMVNQGETKDTTIVVSNTGCQELEVTGTNITGTNASQFSIVSGGGAFTLPQGGTHPLTVRFSPTSGGGKSAQLEITSTDPDENPVLVNLNGAGCIPPDISVSPATWDFGLIDVSSFGEKTFAVANNGCQTLMVTSTTIVGADPDQYSVFSGGGSFDVTTGDTQFVVIRFTPTSGGSKNAILRIISNDPVTDPLDIPLSGDGCSLPDIGVNLTSVDYGILNFGEVKDTIITVTNSGCQDLSVTGINLIGANANQFMIVGGGAPLLVQQGMTDSITVRFQPDTCGLMAADLQLLSNDPDESTVLVALAGEGTSLPDIDVDFLTWDYGLINVGSHGEKTFVISNRGCQELSVTATVLVGGTPGEFEIISGGALFTVPPGGTHNLDIKFEPSSGGAKSTTLRITSNDPDEGTVDITLNGIGCAQTDIVINPDTWDYGLVDVGAFGEKTFIVSNDSCQTLQVTSTILVGANPSQFSIHDGGAPFSVPQGGTHNIVVRFVPSSGGVKNATLQINNNAPGKNPTNVALTGNGCSRPDIGIDPDSWDYSVVNVGSHKDKIFVVSNTGCQTLNVTTTALVGDNPDQFSIIDGGGSFSVPQGGSHNITVRFLPTTVGSKSAILQVASNDPDEATVNVDLSGGVCGLQDIAVDPDVWDYGPVNLGGHEDKTFVITNVGCQDLTITGAAIIGGGGQYIITSGGAAILSQGTTENIVVRFSPASGGTKSATLQISSNDPDEGTVNVNLVGEGCAFPDIDVEPVAWDYEVVNVGAFEEKTFVVSNDSCQTLHVTSTTIQGSNPEFTIISGGAPFTVVQGGTHQIVLRFTPDSGGHKDAVLRIISDDPDESPLDIPLNGEGCEQPDIFIDPTSADFGAVSGGTFKDTTFVISNDSCQTLQVTATSLVGANPNQFAIVAGGAPFAVPQGGNRDLVVRFAPLAAGAKTATLRITSNDPDEGTVDIPLSGFGNASDIQLSATSYNYGDVNMGGFADWILTVTNVGNQHLVLFNIISNNPDFVIVSPASFPDTIAAAGNLNVTIRFTPSVGGPRSATLTITSNDPDEASRNVSLTGTGCVDPDISVNPSSWDYGPVALNGHVDKAFIVSNVGCQNLEITATNVIGPDAALFTIIDGGGANTVGKGGSFNIVVRFEPQTAGAKSATLQIICDDPDESTKNINLQGEGCEAADITVDPSSWNFGQVDVGGFSDITIVVSNAGCQILNVTGTSIVGSNPTQFSVVSGGGPFSLAKGQIRNIVVRFSPTAGGVKNAGLQIASNDPDEGGLIITLSGTGCSLQDIAITPATWSYGVVDVGESQEKTFVVSNGGCQDLEVTGTSLIGADPSQFSIVSGGGASTVPGGGSIDIVVRFAPTSEGSKNAVLRITSDDPDEGTVDVTLAGGVCGFPDIDADPATWDYGPVAVGNHLDKAITISNAGCQDLAVTGTSLVGANANQYTIASGGGAFTVARGETHIIIVRFAPTSEGTKTAGLRIASNDPDQGVFNVPLAGRGCGDPDIAVDPLTWDYERIDVGSFGDKTFEISNLGCQTLQVTATNLTGTHANQFTIISGGAPFSVVQGGTYNLVVRFSPTAGGEKTATLQLISDDPDEGTVNVSLTGEGCVTPDIALNPLFWNYGVISVGSSSEKTIVVSNTGCQDLQITATTIMGTNATEFSIVSGGGFITIASGNAHNVVVRFAPNSGGAKEATLRIISNDPDEGAKEVPLTGEGCSYADIDVNPIFWDFEDVDVGDFEEKVIVISNVGCQGLQVTATSVVGSDPNLFAVIAGGGPFTVAAGHTHDILIRFTPTSGGGKSAVLQISSNDPDENIKNVTLSGEGCSRQDISINPTSWNYGTVDIGSFTDKTFVLSNVGCQMLHVTGVVLAGLHTDQFSIVNGDGAFNLVQGETRNIIVRFAPTSGGGKSVTLQVTSDDPDEPILEVELSGGVCLGPDIGVSPISWNFGQVREGQHTDKSFVISNTGCQLLEISETTIIGPDVGSFIVVSGGGTFTVLQGETHTIVVRFAPTSGGNKSATLQIVNNDPDEGTKEVILTGNGCSQPDIALDPTSWNYGQVAIGTFTNKTFVVSNQGCQDLIVSGTTIVGTDASQFSVVSGGGSFTVVTGGSHTLVVRFLPSDGGTKIASLVIHSNDPDEEEYVVPLTGGALSPDILLSATSHDFDGAPIGQAQRWILEISNSGDGDLVVTSITTDRVDFMISYPTFPQTVAPDEFISVVVVFIPSVTGLITGTMTVQSNDVDEPTLGVSLRGLGLVPDIGLSQNRHDFGGVAVGSTTEWTLTVNNSGTGDLIVENIVSDNPVFEVDRASFTVPSGGNQLLSVTFSPTEEGLTSGQLTIRCNDPDEPVRSVILTGEGLVPNIEVVTSHNFGNVPVGNFMQWTMTIANMGTGPLIVSGIGSDHPNFTVNQTTFTVMPSGSHDVFVTFTPSLGGAISGQITIVSNDPDEQLVTVYVMGTGLVPDINVPIVSYDFGGTEVGESKIWQMVVQNIGTGDLLVTNIATNSADFQVSLTNFTVSPGANQMVDVTFAPTTAGPIVGQLAISSSDPDEPTVRVNVNGVGQVPDIDLSATNHDFGGVPLGQSVSWVLTIFNVGTGDLAVNDVVSSNADFRVDITSFTVTPSGSRNVTVTFMPSIEGTVSGQLTVYSNDPDEPTTSIMVNGDGLVPDIEVPEPDHNFGNVPTDSTAEWMLLLENIGGADLIVTDIRSDNAAFTILLPPLPLTIGPRSSQSVPILFSPSAQVVYNGILTIQTSNDPDESSVQVSLSGVGVPPVSVQLSSFIGIAHNGVVMLRWEVASTRNCLGFHVYRSTTVEGGYERLTYFPIPVADGVQTYRDTEMADEGLYSYRLEAVDVNGDQEEAGVISVKVSGLRPDQFGLSQNYPNPFNPETHITYVLPTKGKVTLDIYNTLGQKVRTLFDEVQPAGWHSMDWNGCNDLGQEVSSGIYFAVLRWDSRIDRMRMLLLK
jgi:hypothetical protein